MARHTATIHWERDDAPFIDNRYSRVHRWRFDGGLELRASSSPSVVPLPMSDASCVDPEEAFVASLASCHMLWFLSIAARRGFAVDRYDDAAEGVMEADADGRLAMTRVTLHPEVHYHGATPSPEDESRLHHEAHESCFLAASVKTEIVVDIQHPAP
jgi:organic hydroperoxide reductase OsmC/OhrA